MRDRGLALITIKGTSTTEGIMKKLTTVLIAAGLIASASACSAQQQLTTAETCDRVGVAAAGIPSNQSKTATTRVANAIRPLEPVASTEMKPVVTAILEFMDEQSKENPDEAKLAELGQAYQEAGTKYGELCRG